MLTAQETAVITSYKEQIQTRLADGDKRGAWDIHAQLFGALMMLGAQGRIEVDEAQAILEPLAIQIHA